VQIRGSILPWGPGAKALLGIRRTKLFGMWGNGAAPEAGKFAYWIANITSNFA